MLDLDITDTRVYPGVKLTGNSYHLDDMKWIIRQIHHLWFRLCLIVESTIHIMNIPAHLVVVVPHHHHRILTVVLAYHLRSRWHLMLDSINGTLLVEKIQIYGLMGTFTLYTTFLTGKRNEVTLYTSSFNNLPNRKKRNRQDFRSMQFWIRKLWFEKM
jgi:hypothetical protein